MSHMFDISLAHQSYFQLKKNSQSVKNAEESRLRSKERRSLIMAQTYWIQIRDNSIIVTVVSEEDSC